jgi:phospholipid/cholesterol/gamma-HCH transport system ATP-binding protein
MNYQPEILTAKKLSEKEIPVIEIKGLYKSFGKNNVLIDFNMKLERGENLVVLGKSGSGKSVLIKCIIGLISPDKGEINVLGAEVSKINLKELDKLRTRIGFLFQSNALYDSMTVRQNLEFPLRRHGIEKTKEEVDSMVMEVLENVGLSNTAEMMPAELSGGMKKRIALARTLILRPEIMLYDEPTTGLDAITGDEIIDLMAEVNEKYNTSSIIITHDMNCVKKLSNRVIVLFEGRAYAAGTYEKLRKTDDLNVKKFFKTEL